MPANRTTLHYAVLKSGKTSSAFFARLDMQRELFRATGLLDVDPTQPFASGPRLLEALPLLGQNKQATPQFGEGE